MKDKNEKWIKEYVERLIKFATEQVREGRNYGWSVDTLSEELSHLLKDQRQELKKKVEETFSNGFTITGIERIDVFPEQKKVKISNDAIRRIKDSIINLLEE